MTTPYNTLHWWDRVGALETASYNQVTDQPVGWTWDLATGLPWQSMNPQRVAELSQLAALNQAHLAAVSVQAATLQSGDGILNAAGEVISNILSPAEPLFTALSYPYHLLATGLSTVITASSLAESTTWQRQQGTSNVGALFDTDTWARASKIAEKRSWGEAFVLALGTEDVLDPAELDKWLKERSTEFHLMSGSMDLLGNLFLDPLILATKIVKPLRLLSTVGDKMRAVDKAGGFEHFMASEPVRRFLTWTQGKTPYQIVQHEAIRHSISGGKVAELLSRARGDELDIIYGIATGNHSALATAETRYKALLDDITEIRGERSGLLQEAELTSFGPHYAYSLQRRAKDLGLRLKDLERQQALYGDVLGPAAGLDEAARRAAFTDIIYGDRAMEYLDELEDVRAEIRFYQDQERALGGSEFDPDFRKGESVPIRDPDAPKQDYNRPWYARGDYILGTGKWEGYYRKRSGRQGGRNTPWRPIPKRPRNYQGNLFPNTPREAFGNGPMFWPDELERMELEHWRDVADRNASIDHELSWYDGADKQLNFADDFYGDQIRRLEDDSAFLRRVLGAGETIQQTAAASDVFGVLHLAPRDGIYGTAGEKFADWRYRWHAGYARKGVQNHYYGWFSHPVRVIQAIPRAFTEVKAPDRYNPADPQHWKTVDQWLRRVKGLGSSQRVQLVEEVMRATDESAKLAAVKQVEKIALVKIMEDAGIVDERTIGDYVARTIGQRDAVRKNLVESTTRQYTAATDEASGVRLDYVDTDGTPTKVHPILATDLLNEHPLLDIELIQRAIWRDRHIMMLPGFRLKDTVSDFLASTQRVWKASVLARLGYAVRTISDDMLATVAALGAMNYLATGIREGIPNAIGNVPAHLWNFAARTVNKPAEWAGGRPVLTLSDKFKVGETPVKASKDGLLAQGMFQGPRASIWRGLTSTEQRVLFDTYDQYLRKLRTEATWGELDPSKKNSHLAAWAHALNEKFGRDPMARMVLNGDSYDEIMTWLNKTPEGIAYSNKNKIRSRDKSGWVESLFQYVGQYTLGFDSTITRLALERKVTTGVLDEVPMWERPAVHGGEIDYNLGVGSVARMLENVTKGVYHLLNKLPTDTLVRHPAASLAYKSRLRQLVAEAEMQGVDLRRDPHLLYQAEETARLYTVQQMRRMFFDTVTHSHAGHALRFVFPFFGAWQGALTRWSRLVNDDPSLVFRFSQGWQGLSKPFEVIDENGQEVDSDAPRPLNTSDMIVTRMPAALAKTLGLDPDATFPIPLKSFNTILQGDPWMNPGFGPLVQIPAGELVRRKPQLADIFKLILPYGPGDNWTDLTLAPSVQKAMSALSSELDDRSYASAWINTYRNEYYKLKIGKRKEPVTLEEIDKKASALMTFRTLAALTGPVPVRVRQEFAFIGDKMRQYRDAYGMELGEQLFLTEFPDAFVWLESTSKNVSGIPANVESWNKSERVKNLASIAPDIFAGVAGITDADQGNFSDAVYNAQFGKLFNPRTGEHMREPKPPIEYVKAVESAPGWRMWRKGMDMLRAELDRRGTPDAPVLTFNDPRAKDLKNARSELAEKIAQMYPAWGQEYTNPDRATMARRIEQATIISQDKGLLGDVRRSDIDSLAAYVKAREIIKEQLIAREASGGSRDLQARGNYDLLLKWNEIVDMLAQSNPSFQQLWVDRYFSNDMLQDVASAIG